MPALPVDDVPDNTPYATGRYGRKIAVHYSWKNIFLNVDKNHEKKYTLLLLFLNLRNRRQLKMY